MFSCVFAKSIRKICKNQWKLRQIALSGDFRGWARGQKHPPSKINFIPSETTIQRVSKPQCSIFCMFAKFIRKIGKTRWNAGYYRHFRHFDRGTRGAQKYFSPKNSLLIFKLLFRVCSETKSWGFNLFPSCLKCSVKSAKITIIYRIIFHKSEGRNLKKSFKQKILLHTSFVYPYATFPH